MKSTFGLGYNTFINFEISQRMILLIVAFLDKTCLLRNMYKVCDLTKNDSVDRGVFR